MSEQTFGVQELYAPDGERLGAFIPEALWIQIQAEVEPLVDRIRQKQEQPREVKEPMQDWNLLMQHWDFPYPVEMNVVCGQCGNTTQDWQQDTPRKFRLKAAGLGGLVAFACLSCGARVSKRHFKDAVKMETTPQKDSA